jgi:hypothetical protein
VPNRSKRCRARKILPALVLAVLSAWLAGATCQGGGEVTDGWQDGFDADRAWDRLERIVALGPRPVGSPALELLRQQIEAELVACGLAPQRETFEDDTPIGRQSFTNIFADIEPSQPGTAPPPLVLVCTHIDTKLLPGRFLGANDGGAGTAVLLEIARVLALERAHSVLAWRILFLDGEEAYKPHWEGLDNRYGSRHHAAELVRTRLALRVRACVLLDLVGDRELVLETELNSDAGLLAHFFQAARDLGLEDHVGAAPRELLDDHLSFLEIGIRSVDLIDFRYGPGNAWWHTEADTLDKCSKASLLAIGRITLRGLATLEL